MIACDELLARAATRIPGLQIDSDHGITLGEPLVEFQGVLRGVPTYVGKLEPLMRDE